MFFGLCGSLPGKQYLFSGSYENSYVPKKLTCVNQPESVADATAHAFCQWLCPRLGHSLYSGAVFTDTLPVNFWAQLAA